MDLFAFYYTDIGNYTRTYCILTSNIQTTTDGIHVSVSDVGLMKLLCDFWLTFCFVFFKWSDIKVRQKHQRASKLSAADDHRDHLMSTLLRYSGGNINYSRGSERSGSLTWLWSAYWSQDAEYPPVFSSESRSYCLSLRKMFISYGSR